MPDYAMIEVRVRYEPGAFMRDHKILQLVVMDIVTYIDA